MCCGSSWDCSACVINVGLIQLILTLTVVAMPISLIWVLIDAFVIPDLVRNHNMALATQLGA
jgi:hypothetical protein